MKLLLALGFVLSLDSFRVSLGLGALKLRATKQIQIVLAFGLCDALAPLLLCAYGAYVIYVARRYAGEEVAEESHWLVLGLPLSLSLDNLVAGASLGMIGFPLLVSVAVIGA